MEDSILAEVNCDNPEALLVIHDCLKAFIGLYKGAEKILEIESRHEEIFYIQLLCAIYYLYSQTQSGQLSAFHYLTKAKKYIHSATDNEKSLYTVLLHWTGREMTQALELLEVHCRKWPHDILALKICEYLYFCKGQHYEAKRFLGLTTYCSKFLKNNPHFLSIHSFAHELNGDYDQAAHIAQAALELEPKNPWAQHTLSHVYINQGWINKGIELQKEFSSQWPSYNRLIASHNFWHLALLYLENRDFKQVWQVYETVDWKNHSESIGEQIDAIALLWRLDMEAKGEISAWNELVNQVQKETFFCTIPFIAAHLIYALKRTDKEEAVKEAFHQMEIFIPTLEGEDQKIWQKFGFPLAKSVIGFLEEDYQKTINLLQPIITKIGAVGGSDAQAVLFQQTYLKSLIHNHQFSEAKEFLNYMCGNRKLTPLEDSWKNACR